MAGRPSCKIPSPTTVGRDVKLAFERSCERIDKILKVRVYIEFSHMIILNTGLEAPRKCSFCYRYLDIAEPSGDYCVDSPVPLQWSTISFPTGYSQSS